MAAQESQSEYIVELARELLDDIELGRLPSDALLLKCSRLARLAGADEIEEWLAYEKAGYNGTEALSLKYVSLTGRWIDRDKAIAYWGPLAQQEAAIAALQAKLQALRVPDISLSTANANPIVNVGLSATSAVNSVLAEARTAANAITQISSVRSRVIARLHDFVSKVYHEKVFSGLAEGIFENYRSLVDELLAERCGVALRKIPSIYERLGAGDPEAISHALTTCRRVIDDFADAVYPPRHDTVEMDGNTVELGAQRHLNRLNAYVRERVSSKSRRIKFRQSLANLYARVSGGVHADVTAQEARALLIETYVMLGEVLTLAEPPPVAQGETASAE
jgi:hypothetical protein